MRACVLTDWEKLELMDVPTPEINDGQVLLRVIYAGICGSDVTVSRHKHPTATVPRIMCHEILGTVVEVKGQKAHVRVGDRVVVHPLSHCGVCEACRDGNYHVCRELGIKGLHSDGGFAEYVSANLDVVFKVPDDIPDKIAILTEPFAVGFHAHVRAGTSAGETVLIVGGGPIGIVAAMCATYFGAACVVISEPNPVRVKLCEGFGFEVINPAKQDQLAEAMRITGGVGFDRVIEASGSPDGAAFVAAACRIRGCIVPVGIPTVPVSYETVKIILKEISLRGSRVYSRENFISSLEMVCRFHREKLFDLCNIIDRIIPLEQLAEGIDMQANGVNNGKILVKVQEA